MRSKDTSFTETHGDQFRSRLEQILDRKHPLYVLADKIDWQRFDQSFGALFAQKQGRLALSTRLVAGLHYCLPRGLGEKPSLSGEDFNMLATWSTLRSRAIPFTILNITLFGSRNTASRFCGLTLPREFAN